jgi:hypothetical protein
MIEHSLAGIFKRNVSEIFLFDMKNLVGKRPASLLQKKFSIDLRQQLLLRQ